MINRATVTFHDPKTDQKIIVNLTEDTIRDFVDVKCKFDPTPNEDSEIGFVGFLAELFLTNLTKKDENAF